MFRLIIQHPDHQDLLCASSFESEGEAETAARIMVEEDPARVITVLRPMARLKSATSVVREPIIAG